VFYELLFTKQLFEAAFLANYTGITMFFCKPNAIPKSCSFDWMILSYGNQALMGSSDRYTVLG